MLRHTTLCAVVVVLTVIGAYAQTPDDDCYGLDDNAWGLCNAYCYAMDCDGDRNASGRDCARVAWNFSRATGAKIMPCETPQDQPGPPTGSCPCNFDLQFWTSQNQILDSTNLPLCTGTADPNTCITCGINTMSSSTTFLSVLVNLWADGISSQEDKLFFFTTEPSSLLGGACGADISLSSGYIFTTEGYQLPVTSEEFGACAFDIGILKDAYATMCSQ